MPTSTMSQVSTIMSLVGEIKPASVIDVGIGYGKYGFLCRELLEFMGGAPPRFSTMDDTQTAQESAVVIDGIEAYEESVTPLHRLIYGRLFVGDALEMLPTIATKTYDLALAIDILEHFEEPDGRRFIAELVRVARAVIIATPRDMAVQGAVHGNEWETHRAEWSKAMLLETGARLVVRTAESWIGVYGDTPEVSAMVWQHSWGGRIPKFPGKRFLGALRRRLK